MEGIGRGAAAGSGERGRVLLVEDHPANRKLTAAILSKAGYEVLLAEDAAAGLRLARQHRPDLVLLDIQLPGMDGLEAARCLREDPATGEIPLVALTAFAMKGDARRLLEAGFDDYLAKPVSRQDLLAAIRRHLPEEDEPWRAS